LFLKYLYEMSRQVILEYIEENKEAFSSETYKKIVEEVAKIKEGMRKMSILYSSIVHSKFEIEASVEELVLETENLDQATVDEYKEYKQIDASDLSELLPDWQKDVINKILFTTIRSNLVFYNESVYMKIF